MIIFLYYLHVSRSAKNSQKTLAIVLLLDNRKSVEFKHKCLFLELLCMFNDHAQQVCMVQITENFKMLTKLIPSHEKGWSSKGFCLEFCTHRTIYNKSSALRRTGQENPNYVKMNTIVQKHIWKCLSKVQVYEQRTSVCWSQAFQTVFILGQKRPAMIQIRLHRWLLMNPT